MNLVLNPATSLSSSPDMILHGLGLEHDFVSFVEVSLQVLPNELSLALRSTLVIEDRFYHLKVLLVIGLHGVSSGGETCVEFHG